MVVLVPEGGDEVQSMKAGLMEIADVFVVNKSDRPGADQFVQALRQMLAPAFAKRNVELPIVKTAASLKTGIADLYATLKNSMATTTRNEKQTWLLTERAWQLIQQKRMRDVDRKELQRRISEEPNFNLYRFVETFTV